MRYFTSMHAFEQELIAAWPPNDWHNRSILLAVSGGADSVALLRGICRLREVGAGRVSVAHFNHGVRGEAANRDEQFVANLGQALDVPVVVGRKPPDFPRATANEESLRAARYQFLQQTAEQIGARYVVTAHTQDDQIETILHRILRGTGIPGLKGIPRIRTLGDAVVIIRPLLQTSRTTILDYLNSLEQAFREDATNLDPAYTRNRVRHELLPLLKEKYNATVGDAILRLGQLAGEAEAIIESLVESQEHAVCIESSEQAIVDCYAWKSNDAPLVRRLLLAVWQRQAWPLAEMGYQEWQRLGDLATGNQDRTIELPGAIRAQKEGAWLKLTRLRKLQVETKND